MKKIFFGSVSTVIFALSMCGVGSAASVSYDASLAGPGWYDGTSVNPNGGFTIANSNGIEIGLRAKERQGGIIDSLNNVYHVPVGAEPGVPSRAWWNYEFSINLQPAGTGSLTLADIFPYSTFRVQDLTVGASETVNLPYWGDNSTFGPGGKDAGPMATAWSTQNSENPTFVNFPLALVPGYTFDMNAQDYYRFTLNVRDAAGASLGIDTIDVAVGGATGTPAPEPATLPLLFAGLAGVFVVSRKKAAQTTSL